MMRATATPVPAPVGGRRRHARAVLPPALERLAQHVAASERRHTGEIRIYVEAGLPASYIWRDAPRERAIAMFGKLGVWDTERTTAC